MFFDVSKLIQLVVTRVGGIDKAVCLQASHLAIILL